MIEDGITPEQVGFNEFEIPSQTNNKKYIVSMHAGTWSCTCPDHQFRHVTCKHIHAVTLWQRLSTKLQQDHKKKIMAKLEPITVEELTCKFCGSSHVIEYGKAHDKQVYKCKDCARKFVPNKGFEEMWYDPRTVSATLDLYFKGVSLRKIADHLRQYHGLEVNHSSVYRWICEYTDIIQAYEETLEPNVGNIWHSGEMKIKIRGDGDGFGTRWIRKQDLSLQARSRKLVK